MKKTKKMLAFVLATAMMVSNVAYAAPASGDPSESDATVDTFSFDNPKTDIGESSPEDAYGSGDATAADQQTGQNTGDVTGSETAGTSSSVTAPEQTTPADQPTASESVDAASVGSSQTETDSTAGGDGTGASQEEQESTLYDVTFTTPEKHGKILRMDDTEVTDGTALKTDENGKAQFKVKADDGYQVDKVINKTTGEELKLIEDSYYELQVEVNTTVEVHYNKVPADEKSDDSEDADDADAAETTDGAVAEDEAAPSAKIDVANLLAQPRATVPVKINLEGQELTDGTINTGTVTENIPSYENYTFTGATVEGVEIVYIGQVTLEGKDYTYYSVDGVSAVLLGENTNIVLNYEKNPFGISYSSNDERLGKVVGPESAKEGETVTFTAEPELGSRLVGLTVNDENKFVEGQTTYDFVMGTSEVKVQATFEESSSFNVSYNPVGNTSEYTSHPDGCANKLPASVENGGTLQIKLNVNDKWADLTDNKSLEFVIVNGHIINLSEHSAQASFDGMDISISREDERHGLRYFYYNIKITNVKKDLKIDYCVKDNAWFGGESTIIIAGLDSGISLATYEDGGLKNVSEGDIFYMRGDSSRWFYVKTQPGYQAMMSAGGSGTNPEKVYSMAQASSADGHDADPAHQTAVDAGYMFEFWYSGTSNDNRTVYLSSQPIEYSVNYQSDGGDYTPEDTDTYTINGNNVISIASQAPKKDGFVFAGWKVGSNVYQAGSSFTIDETTVGFANESNQFVFEAQWVEEGKQTTAGYTVNYSTFPPV